MGTSGPRVSDAWERRAAEWAAWARTPGQDVYFTHLNWPAFEPLLPVAGRLTMTCESIDRPLEHYARALEDAGFVVEALREPRADAAEPALAPAARRPFFLHLRCVRRAA